MFQNLRENQQIYVLTKAPVPSLDMGTVIKIQDPVPNFQAGSNMMGYTMDITVSVNGINRPFPQLPVNKDSAEYVNEQTIIAMSRDAMNAELNSLYDLIPENRRAALDRFVRCFGLSPAKLHEALEWERR